MTASLVDRLLSAADGAYEGNVSLLLREAAEALARRGEWRLIETAPRDGTPMLVHSRHGWIGRVRWSTEEECFEDEHTEFVRPDWLTHWMPLPPPPSRP